MEEIAECYAGWLWCLNMVEAVEAKPRDDGNYVRVVTLCDKIDEREFSGK